MKGKVDTTILALILLSLVGIAEAAFVGTMIVSNNQEISEIHSKILAEQARKESFNELIEQYTGIEEEGIIQDIEDLLPSSDNFLSVIEEIEEIAELSGSSLIISLGDARLTTEGFELPNDLRNQSVIGRTLPADANYDFLEIEITIRGSYKELQQFLNLFNQSEYYMNITSLSSNRVSSTDKAFLDTHMTVEIFVQQIVFTN